MNRDSCNVLVEFTEQLQTFKEQLDDIASFDKQLTSRQRDQLIGLLRSMEQMIFVLSKLTRRRRQ